MKRLLIDLLVTFGALAIIFKVTTLPYSDYTKFLYFSNCNTPIHWKVETVDPKFGLSKNQFQKDAEAATNMWSSALEKPLFVYDQQGKLSVNLLYDERQSLNNQITSLENQVQTQQDSLKPNISQYQKESADFKTKLDDFNRQVDDWNSKGGAPRDVYNKLKAGQNDLRVEAQKLEAMAKGLNQSTSLYNSSVSQLNQTISTFNYELSQRPEEGIYNPNLDRIEIYFDTGQSELIHTLAHEFGHSLGLDHSKNPKAIMYSSTNQQTKLTGDDIAALKNACQNRSYLDLEKQKLQYLYDQLQKDYFPNQ